MAGGLGLFQALEVGVHDGLVALDAEDQRDVDADPLGDDRGDGRQAGSGGRDLDQDVGPVHGRPQRLGRRDRRLGVVGQVGLHLDGDAAVVCGPLRDGGQDVAGVADVLGGQLEDHLVDVLARGDELSDLLVVALAVRDGAGEDRGVGGDPDDRLLLDELGEVAGLDALAGQVVQPDRHPGVGQGLQSLTHACSSVSSRAWWWKGVRRSAGGGDAVTRGVGDGPRGEAVLGEEPGGGRTGPAPRTTPGRAARPRGRRCRPRRACPGPRRPAAPRTRWP